MTFVKFLLALVYGVAAAPLLLVGFILGALLGVFAVGFRAGGQLARLFWTVKVDGYARAAVVLLIPTCLLGWGAAPYCLG